VVVDEVAAAGGEAVASHHDVSDFEDGRALIEDALAAFGRLDVLVNNAGVLRDRAIVNMDEADWDVVVGVHLKGHFVTTRWAGDHWRNESKAGRPVQASVVHTSSTSGLFGNPGQANYGAAKAGIAAFSAICATELGRYGVRSNCVVPAARTRLTEATPGLADLVAAPEDDTQFDRWHPSNVSPLVAYLATADCPLSGTTLFVQGGVVRSLEGWRYGAGVEREERWSITALAQQLPAALSG
jgi:NAD(P)-dependent dehydrogenase (short-subunit alcohol dehydrogenase family)